MILPVQVMVEPQKYVVQKRLQLRLRSVDYSGGDGVISLNVASSARPMQPRAVRIFCKF